MIAMKYKTTFTCEEDACEYGLSGKYKREGGNWEFELSEIYNENDEWGVIHIGKDCIYYTEKFVKKVKNS